MTTRRRRRTIGKLKKPIEQGQDYSKKKQKSVIVVLNAKWTLELLITTQFVCFLFIKHFKFYENRIALTHRLYGLIRWLVMSKSM